MSNAIYTEFTPRLLHEVGHYVYDREATEESPFVAEGEASAAGERMMQVLIAATRAPKDGLRETSRKEIIGFAVRQVAKIPFTASQIQLFCRVKADGITAQQIREALETTKLQLETARPAEVEKFYARAWAIYAQIREDAADGELELDWQVQLDTNVAHVANGFPPDLQVLKNIAAKTNDWINQTEDKHGYCK